MRGLDSWKGRLLTFVVALFLALIAVYAAGSTKDNHSSISSGSSRSANARGAEATNGPASFIGHASNAVMFIQWTRSGQNVTGSLREAITRSGSLSLESVDHAFTGVIAERGITLNLHGVLGENTAYVGEIGEHGFSLTVPGRGSNLITIDFEPSAVSGYDEATKQLFLARYPSPCSLYVVDHEVRVTFGGPNSAEDCASFVEKAGDTAWTTAPQAEAVNGLVVCELENGANEKATITDGGEQEYGREACTQLSGEGWG